MKALVKGHVYELDNLKDPNNGTTELKFYSDPEINKKHIQGTSNQEVLRAVIDRVKFLDNQKPHPLNDQIIEHLRKALVLHEMRHLDMLVEKGKDVENIKLKSNGHFLEY